MADISQDILYLQQQVQSANIPADLRDRLNRMISRLSGLSKAGGSSSFQELEMTSKYIEWIIQLPFNRYSQDNLDIKNAKQVLNDHHYGLDSVKENILEFIATQSLKANSRGDSNTPGQQQPQETSALSPNQSQQASANQQAAANGKQTQKVAHAYNYIPGGTPVLCFVGVQGIGKTTMAKSIAESLGRRFVRIPLGAFASVYEIRGRNKGEAGAEPGQLIKAIIKAGSMNPVILLDEIDKVSSQSGLRADLMAALLEVLDPNQNHSFTDRYIDYPVDLSQVLFITTANNLKGISAALLDRLEVIRFHSYTDKEKQVIAKQYLMPKVREKTGITAEQLAIEEDTWELLIRPLGFDPGIRQLERNLTNLCRKVAKMIVEGQVGKVVITRENFRDFFPEQIAVMS